MTVKEGLFPSLLFRRPGAAVYDFEIFEKESRITTSQLQEFSTTTGHSIRNTCRTAWVLHRHIYEGSAVVDLIELGPGFKVVAEVSHQVDESKTLSQICRDLRLLSCHGPENYGLPGSSALLLAQREHKANEQPESMDPPAWKNGIAAAISCSDDSITLSLLYDKTRVDERTVVGYWHTFEKILQSIIQDSHLSLHDTDFLSDHDRNQIIAWNTPVPEKPQEQTICSRINEQVLSRPAAPAIYAWDGSMTYAELDDAAFKMSLELRSFGVMAGDIVPFCLEKSKWAPVAALAILKSGAALVPMDPAWPKQRFHSILEATEATVVICSQETRSCLDDMLSAHIFLLYPNERISKPLLTSTSRPTDPSPTDIAFILFSSGSTGVPKGMIREHGTACVGSIAHAEAMHIDANSRVLQFASHVFDVAMLDFFTTLIMGGCICIPSEFDRRNNLAVFIQQSQANWVLLTPTVAGMLDPVTVPSLRDVTLGGEAITAGLLEKWLPHCRVGINYGSAEVDVTHTRDVQDSQDPANVGKRIRSCVCYVVDPNDTNRILPIGATGELLISAPTMARAYLKQPQRTEISFIPAPVDWYHTNSNETKSPWLCRAYRMGDLVQQQQDGSFRFIGRRDFQVKIRGQKVELGEVESQLATHPAVKLCTVMYPRSGPYAERLVVVIEAQDNYKQTKSSPRIGLEEVKVHLSQKVTSYMLPQICILVDPMPLTATLKIDRQKLMMWLVEQDTIAASGHIIKSISTSLKGPELSPDDLTGLTVSTMIADLIANAHTQYWYAIHGHDNSFSQLGLDSVQIMRLSHLVSRNYGIKIAVETLTDQTMSVKRLAILIDNIKKMDNNVPLQGMTVDRLREKLAKSMAQIRDDSIDRCCIHVNGDRFSASCGITRSYKIFLTGATGYLGSHILRSLLESTRVERVHVLVRSKDAAKARMKQANAAKAANWAIEKHMNRLEIWQGDLSQTRLGLEDCHWQQLTQTEESETSINCIIHCGAVVDWTRSYKDLEAPNVMSTVELLNITLEKKYPTDFVYISGGQYFRLGDDNGYDRIDSGFKDAAASNGYAQTKFVSEQLVEDVRRGHSRSSTRMSSFHVVKPAYLIGTVQDGVANSNDYLWRVVSAAIRQRSYNADEDQQWLLVADVGKVANTIAEVAMSTAAQEFENAGAVKILNGIKVRDFWSTVEEVTMCQLLPVSGQEWLAGVKATMELDPQHVLWPLLDVLERNSGLLTNQRLLVEEVHEMKGVTSVADVVKRNVEHLVAIGFLASAWGQSHRPDTTDSPSGVPESGV